MIEVEKKFKLTTEQETRLLEGATFLNEQTNVDVFFDTDDFRFTTDDTWLRTRNGRYEIKMRLHNLGHGDHGTVYDEIEEENRIREILGLDPTLPMEKALAHEGITPFARIEKQRKSYEKNGFHIDLDICDFGYELAEIELLVKDETQTKDALDRIEEFAEHLGLDSSPQRGKAIEYLYRFRPDHYQALLDAGVIDL